jgi:hypothetical protein
MLRRYTSIDAADLEGPSLLNTRGQVMWVIVNNTHTTLLSRIERIAVTIMGGPAM